MIVCRGPRILAFRKFDESGLSIPCGKINLDEDTLAAAVREVREETGYVVEAADRPPFVAYDTYGGALVTTYLGHIVGGSLLELAGTEGIPSWASVREVARGPFWHYNCQALRHFGLAIPLAGKFHSHITLDSATPLSEAERAAALSGGKLTTIHLERDGRQQVDLMVTHHYLTGARNLEDEHDVLNLLKARALQIGQSGATVTRVKLEHEPLDVRSDRSELSESLSRVYTEIHVKCIVTPERLGMVVRNGAAAGWHPSKNPFATRADGQFVQFVNRRFYTTPGTPLDMSLIDAEVAKLVLLIEHVASIDEIKYESAIYDSNDALDRWWMQS